MERPQEERVCEMIQNGLPGSDKLLVGMDVLVIGGLIFAHLNTVMYFLGGLRQEAVARRFVCNPV